MSLLSIRNEIIEVLNTVVKIKAIYYESPTIVNITPSVAVLLAPGVDEPDTTCDNTMNSSYILRLMVEKTDDNDNGKAQTDRLLVIVDEVLDKMRLKTNTILDNQAYSMMPDWGGVSIGDAGNLNVYYVDVTLSIKTLKSIL